MRIFASVVTAVLLSIAPMVAEATMLSGTVPGDNGLQVSDGYRVAELTPGPVPGDRYITFGGLDWAWASPASSFGGFDINAPADGWRVATLGEFALRPAPGDFGPPDAFKCASEYFSGFSHCDFGDALAGHIARDYTPNAGFAPSGVNCNLEPCEIWVVRGQRIPAPATLTLVALGLALAAPVLLRRR